jgi:fructose-1,6-bisphosphatase/inositol monophosphatase family enzyme
VCVSIGLTIGKVPTVGVVYNPIMDEVRILIFNISGQPMTILSMHRVMHGHLHFSP